MCRSLKVLCAAPDAERLGSLKRAAVGAEWELVAGARSVAELFEQLIEWRPDVVVIDASLGAEAFERARALRPEARLVVMGEGGGPADAEAGSLDEVRPAILGIQKPGGPVRA
jgi:DNA-binding NarL/FixJ family response regulator